MIEVIKEIPCSAVEWDNCNLATNVKAQETKQSLFKNIYNKIPFNTIMRETREKKTSCVTDHLCMERIDVSNLL